MKISKKLSPVYLVILTALLLFNLHLGDSKLDSQASTINDTKDLYSIQWNTTYIMRDMYSPRSLVQLKDGNYLVVGNRYPSCEDFCPQSDVFLMRTTPEGSFIWLELYGEDNNAIDLGYFVIETDDGFVISGRTNGPPAIGSDFMIIKTDFDGQLKWKQTYNLSSEGEISSFIQTTDKGFALLGVSLPNNGTSIDENMWLLKTDSEGNAQWNRTYSQNFIEYTSMIQINDGGFVFTTYDGNLLKIDESGKIEWEKKIGGKLFSMIGDNGSLVVFGSKLDQPWLVKTDLKGDIQWNKSFSFNITSNYLFSPNRSNLLNLVRLSDSSFVLTGSSIQVPENGIIKGSDLWIAKTNNSGDIEWSHKFRVDSVANFRSVLQNSEGDIILVGDKKR
ncbi:MAG: PQQ-like beta-propeller repeat protein, partial [Candidatus Heimdallarchaeota archaeon]